MEGDPNYRFLTDAEFNRLVNDVRLDPATIKQGEAYYFIQRSSAHKDDFLEKYGSKPVRPNNIYANIVKAKINRIDDGVTTSPLGVTYPKGFAAEVIETNNDTPNYGRISKRHRERRVSGYEVTTGMKINDNNDWVAIQEVKILKTGNKDTKTRIGNRFVYKPKLGAANSYAETGSEVTDREASRNTIGQQGVNQINRNNEKLLATFEVTKELVVTTNKHQDITIPVGGILYSFLGFNSEICYNDEHRDDEEPIDTMGGPFTNIGTGCFIDLEYTAPDGVKHIIPHVTSTTVESHMKSIHVAAGRTRRNRRRGRKTRRRRIFICDV